MGGRPRRGLDRPCHSYTRCTGDREVIQSAILNALVASWLNAHGEAIVRVADLVSMCEINGCFMDVLGDKKPEGRPRLLGRIIAKVVGRYIGGYKVAKAGVDYHGVAMYRLEAVKALDKTNREPGEDDDEDQVA
jgi:hypothetical protein